ncbi:MAG: glycosyltransferase family 39 protein [Elusimicrobia bacterium]|nr:glycosyltransferase family 39 protein [Elusimicrobiota bacterium]
MPLPINPILGLIAVLAFAACLRFLQLKKRGFLFWDDGVRMQETLYVSEIIAFVRKNFKDIFERKVTLKEASKEFHGRFPFDINPLNIFSYWLTSRITGNIEFSGLTANAFLGLAGILGTFFLGDLLGGPSLGLLAALTLSISAYHLGYSRSIHAESGCGAFYVWATYFYLSSILMDSTLRLAVSGVCLGMAFTSNSRQFYIPFFFFACECLTWFFFPQLEAIPRILILSASSFLPQLIIEEAYLFLRAVGYPYPTYFMQLVERTGQSFSLDLRLPSLRIYWRTFYDSEGPLFILLVLLGSGLILSQPNFSEIFVLCQWILPILFWSLRPTQEIKLREGKVKLGGSIGTYQFAVPRLASSAIYSMAIAIATILNSLKPEIFYWVIGIYSLMAVFKCRNVMRMRGGFKKAHEFIAAQGEASVVSFCPPITEYYLNDRGVIYFDSIQSEEDLKKCYSEKKARFLLYVPMIYTDIQHRFPLPYLNTVLTRLKPVYSVPQGVGQFWPYYCENNFIRPTILKPNPIEVYDLSQLYGQEHAEKR